MTLNNKLLLTFTLLLVGFTTMANNKFTTEEQLASRLNNEIKSFWQQGDFSSFSGVKNTRINYASFVHKKDSNAQCIVISSGRTESYLKYKELSFDLFNLGYNIFLLDHRGQGLSARLVNNSDKGYIDNFQYYVDDLANFIDHQVMPYCTTKPYLLAHSMGGAIAAKYLQDFPDQIKAAVLSSPMLGFNSGGIPEFIAESVVKSTAMFNQWFDDAPWYFLGQKDYEPTTFEDNALMHSKERYQEFSQLYQNTPKIQLGGVTAQWLAKSIAALEQIFTDIDKIITPTLVLQAGGEQVINNQSQDDFCAKLHQLQPNSCPEGKPVIIADAYHELFFESDKYREPALNAVVDWFAKHP